jgi:2Fe-2S ferredoxin
MPHIVVVTRTGEEIEVDATVGDSLMETIRGAGIDEMLAMCGGNCACATCHILIDNPSASMPGRSEAEVALLETSLHFAEQSRLACQVSINDGMDGLRIVIAPED